MPEFHVRLSFHYIKILVAFAKGDWHPRKSSSNSLYFQGDLYRHFHALLSSEEKQEIDI